MKHLKSFYIFFLIVFLLSPFAVFPQQLHLPLRNYTVKDFGVEGQNWSILQDKRGVMYFGNNYGVFEYDGNKWDLISKHNGVYFMGLAMDHAGRIYVGMVGDFGYLAPDNEGKTEF
jgi:hypothetical protein